MVLNDGNLDIIAVNGINCMCGSEWKHISMTKGIYLIKGLPE